MTLPVDLDLIHNPAALTVPPRAWGEAIRSNFEARLGEPIAEMARFTVSVPNNTATVIGFPGGASLDTDNMQDPAINNDQITAQTAGMYLVSAAVIFPESTPGTAGYYWSLRLQLNGVDILPINQPSISGLSRRLGLNVVRFVPMNAGDYLRLSVLQNTGASRTASFRFSAWRVGPITPTTGFAYADLDTIQQLGFGDVAEPGLGDQIRTNFQSLANRPICVLGKSGTQNIPNDGTFYDATWTTEVSDAFGMHSLVAPDNDTIQLARSGLWLVVGNIVWATESTGTRSLRFYTNSTFTSIDPFFFETLTFAPGAENHGASFAMMIRSKQAEAMVMQVRQTSAVSLNLQTNCQLGVVWLGE